MSLQAARGCPDFAPFMGGIPVLPLKSTKSVGAPLHQCQTARHWLLAVHLTCIYVAAKNVEVRFSHESSFRAPACHVIFLARLRGENTVAHPSAGCFRQSDCSLPRNSHPAAQRALLAANPSVLRAVAGGFVLFPDAAAVCRLCRTSTSYARCSNGCTASW